MQETGTRQLKPLWANLLVVKLKVSIGIARKCFQHHQETQPPNGLSQIHESLNPNLYGVF